MEAGKRMVLVSSYHSMKRSPMNNNSFILSSFKMISGKLLSMLRLFSTLNNSINKKYNNSIKATQLIDESNVKGSTLLGVAVCAFANF